MASKIWQWGTGVAAFAAVLALAGGCGSDAASAGHGQHTTPAPQGANSTALPAPQVPLSSSTTTAHTGKWVALTFDDGPGKYTDRVLAMLQRYHAKATFCMIGTQVVDSAVLVRKVSAAGMGLCDHTMHHEENLSAKPLARIKSEILDDRDDIQRETGKKVLFYRNPAGNWSPQIRRVASGYGLRSLAWTVDTDDWAPHMRVSGVLANVRRELKPGGVILMHDGGGHRETTVAALQVLLPMLIKEGYQFDFPSTTAP